MKKFLLIFVCIYNLSLFAQGILTVSMNNNKLMFYKNNETINVYYVELFPGEVFDGWIYYYSNTTQKMYGSLIESPDVEWLKISPNNFYSAGCDSSNIIPIKYTFTAPKDTGLYKTIIKDQREFYNELLVVLHVTFQPNANNLNVNLSSCKTKIDNDTITFTPTKHGCVERYYPAREGKISLSTYPKASGVKFDKNVFTASFYGLNEYHRYYESRAIGVDTVYEITYMQWISYPIYKKIIMNTKPDENVVLSFNNICNNFPVIDCYITITDSCGNIISDNSNLIFEVKEDGVKENFKLLRGYNGDNLSIVFVIDRSGSMTGEPILCAKNAAKTFIDKLGENDIMALISFNNLFTIDEEYTKDKNKIKSTIDNLNAYGSTAVYDALYAAAEYSRKGNCRNIIILLTDGGDNSSRYSATEAISKCVSSGFPVYCVGLGNSYDSQLRNIAEKTGGLFAHANNHNELNDVYNKIFDQIKSQLLIRYTTHNIVKDSTLREIRINVSNGISSDEKSKFYYSPKDIVRRLSEPRIIKPKKGEEVSKFNLSFIWNKVNEAKNYMLLISSDSTFANIIVNQIVSDTFFIANYLKKNCNYYWKVLAINNKDTSSFSITENFKVVNSKPEIPTLIFPDNNITLKNSFPQNIITFVWSRSFDYDYDTLLYFLTLKKDSETKIIKCNSDTSKVIDINKLFVSGGNFSWYVMLSDGIDTIYSETNFFNITSDITNVSSNILPKEYKLFQNYPNPFNPTTVIKYSIPKSGFVQIKIFDVLGREVKTVVSEYKNPGNYIIEFDGSNFNSGVYYYNLKINDYSEVKKMILIK